ncbi:MAG TPA: PP2C family protein-serine/threonine phosphatase, partial [Thermoanaerobaculia bacterium]
LFVLCLFVFRVVPLALLSFSAGSGGESLCRVRGGHKLAAFDALFQGAWVNRTVAGSSFVGVAAGLLLAGLLLVAQLAVQLAGAGPQLESLLGEGSAAPGLQLLTGALDALPLYLVVALCIVPPAVKRFGRFWGGALAVPVSALVALPFCPPVPLVWAIPVALVHAAFLIGLFLAEDLLAALLAGFVAQVALGAYPLLQAVDPALQANGALALVVAVLPLLLSLRSLGRGAEFVYRYEDVPPHVRRIAERERQRVELETARGIQSSILPDLPESLLGVEIAHRYLPASEVGGDFYDVLALEDGRLAVAVGDVAGHGVSSGLVMSMAKSALAVQVTFDPEVPAVFRTLNRMVYQTARKRLLSTLCYAILDPQRRELLFASAGHIFPYRVSDGGVVSALEATGYPLGVRGSLEVRPLRVALAPGDFLFLCSDGLVEARSEGSDDLYGFERLEESLARHAHHGAARLLEGVLADVTRFTRHAPREDDLTALVLRLPAA